MGVTQVKMRKKRVEMGKNVKNWKKLVKNPVLGNIMSEN